MLKILSPLLILTYVVSASAQSDSSPQAPSRAEAPEAPPAPDAVSGPVTPPNDPAVAPAPPLEMPAKQAAAPENNGRVQEAKPELAGDLRAPSPKALDKNRRGYFQEGLGLGYGAGMKSDSLMYDVAGSYNFNLSDNFTIKGFLDLTIATGSVSSRLLNFGPGVEYYIGGLKFLGATPYVAADVGVGFGRNAIDQTATGLVLGGGAGFKFQVAELNFDLNGHYSQLTAQVGDTAPSIFVVRGGLLF